MNMNEINIDDCVPDKKTFIKERKNKIFLSDYQIEVLKQNNIEYEKFGSLKDLLFEIEEILNDGYESEELAEISRQISEFLYYNYTNK